MFESPPAIVELGPSSGWSLPAGDRRGRGRDDCGRPERGQIIVCGRRQDFGIGPLGPDPRPLVEEIADALTFPLSRGIDVRPGDFEAARSNANGIRFRIRF